MKNTFFLLLSALLIFSSCSSITTNDKDKKAKEESTQVENPENKEETTRHPDDNFDSVQEYLNSNYNEYSKTVMEAYADDTIVSNVEAYATDKMTLNIKFTLTEKGVQEVMSTILANDQSKADYENNLIFEANQVNSIIDKPKIVITHLFVKPDGVKIAELSATSDFTIYYDMDLEAVETSE